MPEFMYVILVVILVIMFLSYSRRFPGENMLEVLDRRRISRMEARNQFNQIAARYRKQAGRAAVPYIRNNLLGLAALNEKDGNNAVLYLKKALDGVIGEDTMTVQGNLAMAYLQTGQFDVALSLLEDTRANGYIPIVSYVMALLVNDQQENARNFYLNHPLNDHDHAPIMTLIHYTRDDPKALDDIRKMLVNGQLWLYHPALEALIDKWELEIFYNRIDRYAVLADQAEKLLIQLEQQIFNSYEVRYMRSIIASISGMIRSYEGCASLWGLIFNLDDFSLGLPVEESLRRSCQLFWQRLYHIIRHTMKAEFHDRDKELKLISLQMPQDAQLQLGKDMSMRLFTSCLLRWSLCISQLSYSDFVYHELFLMTEEATQMIMTKAVPIRDIINEDASTKPVLEPLLYELMEHKGELPYTHWADVVSRLPEKYHQRLGVLR